MLAALVGDPISKLYPDLTVEVNARRARGSSSRSGQRDRPFRLHVHLQQLRPPDERRAGHRGVRAGAPFAVRRDEGGLRAAPARPGGAVVLADRPSDRDRVRALAADALRPDDRGVHPDAGDRRGARRLRRRHLAPVLPRGGHLQGDHDRAGRARRSRSAATSSTSATTTRTTRSGWWWTWCRSTSAARAGPVQRGRRGPPQLPGLVREDPRRPRLRAGPPCSRGGGAT